MRATAQRARMSAAYVCDIENGNRPVSGPAATRLLRLLDVTP
jgi:hypothetical protein